MPRSFTYHRLRVIQSDFSSPLADLVVELEYLRWIQLSGDTPSAMFFQIKDILHALESLWYARFDVEYSTLSNYFGFRGQELPLPDESVQEIHNIECAMDYVDKTVHAGSEITEQLICALHRISVEGLSHAGSKTPGHYRKAAVYLKKTSYLPPDSSCISGLIQELVAFINDSDAHKYDLLKVAQVNQRFCWIHPFDNGNGRVGRLLSYAMMIKYGFKVQVANRLLNPTAVFCRDRSASYVKLSGAHTGTYEGLEAWCLYVLSGIRDEIKKVEWLTDYDYLKNKILTPALAYSKSVGMVTDQEEAVLLIALARRGFRVTDLDEVLDVSTPQQRSEQLTRMQDAQLIRLEQDGSSSYGINFTHGCLLPGVIHAFEQQGFIPRLAKACKP